MALLNVGPRAFRLVLNQYDKAISGESVDVATLFPTGASYIQGHGTTRE